MAKNVIKIGNLVNSYEMSLGILNNYDFSRLIKKGQIRRYRFCMS